MDVGDRGGRRPAAAVETTPARLTFLEDEQETPRVGRRHTPAEVGIRSAIVGLVLLSIALIVSLAQAI